MESKLTVLLTGGNKGIGFEILSQLINNSPYEVDKIVFTVRSEEKGKRTQAKLLETISKSEISKTQIEIMYEVLDITNEKDIRRLSEKLYEKNIQIDFLILNAGIFLKSRHQTVGMVQKTLNVRFKTLFYSNFQNYLFDI